MSEQPTPGAAQADNLSGADLDIRIRPQDRADPEDLRMGGVVCRFELVRGRGDAEISRLAELQHGLVHLHQLRAAGIGRNAVAHRRRIGQLHGTFPGIYLVGRPQRTLLGQIMGAALYFRGDALVTGRAGAHVWSVLDTTQTPRIDAPIDVLLVGRNSDLPAGIRVHRTKALPKQDIRWRSGIPVASPARVLLDLAATMDAFELEAVLSAAFRKRLLRRAQLDDVMSRNPKAKGVGKLRRLLDQTESLHDTRSRYERRLLELLEAAELPRPITNTWVGEVYVDGLWPDLKLVYEFDGWQRHGERDGFETDRIRDQRLLIAGHQRVRITARQIDRQPYALVARLAGIITALRLNAADASAT